MWRVRADDCYAPTHRRVSGLGLDRWLRRLWAVTPSGSPQLFAAAVAWHGWRTGSRGLLGHRRVPAAYHLPAAWHHPGYAT